MGKKKFVQLNYSNMSKYYHKHKLIKGAMVRYRFAYDTQIKYGLTEEPNRWQVGIVSKISWYAVPPYSHNMVGSLDKDAICFDISVHNITDALGVEVISLEANEIFLLTD